MSTKELLIEEINQAPEDVLRRLLNYLYTELHAHNGIRSALHLAAGPYADYWNQFIGVWANQEWERPPQDDLEEREAW
jgi:hypothetical protein